MNSPKENSKHKYRLGQRKCVIKIKVSCPKCGRQQYCMTIKVRKCVNCGFTFQIDGKKWGNRIVEGSRDFFEAQKMMKSY